MKRIAAAIVFSGLLSGAALAADLPQPYIPPPPRAPAAYVPVVVPVYNWNGFYVGLNGGYGFGDSNWTNPTTGDSTGNFDLSGGLAGGQIGWNYQMGQFVFGIEGDMDWSGIKGTSNAPGITGCVGCQTSNNWLSTVRARFGFAWDRVLVYGTAGGAFGDVKATTPLAFGGMSQTSTEAGWAAGAGVEVGITENITGRVEYLFVDLADGKCDPATCSSGTESVNVKFDTSIVRAGINLKFSGF
jgi:outer membrane immunogenic protein